MGSYAANDVVEMASGIDAIKRLAASIPLDCEALNEADTRHQIIDRLIHECLGWSRSEVRLERQMEGDYSDYELGTPPRVLIEAKRAGKSFVIPAEETKPGALRSLRSLISASKEFALAFNQACDYCKSRGIPFGVVTNGHQFVVFLGSRTDGISPRDGRCLLFDGWNSIEENFTRLWQVISGPGSKEKVAAELLSPGVSPKLPKKISMGLPGYPSLRYLNDFQNSLRTLSDLLIEDAPNSPPLRKRFYSECYCESGALAQEALIGRNILASRYAAMFSSQGQQPALEPVRRGDSDRFGLSNEVVAEALGRRPIVIIGDVGVGKTSFIRHLIFVKAEREMRDAIFIYLDLGTQANLGQDIREFFIEDIERQLLRDYSIDLQEDSFVRGVYHGELVRFERGIYGPLKTQAPDKYLEKQIEFLGGRISDRIAHLRHSIHHISKGRKKQVVISIDNADQRNFEDQQAAFLAAQEFSSQWDALVLVSLRPKTYFMSKFAGSVSAYSQRLLTISPPRVDLVLTRRLQFSLDLAQGKLPLERLEGISLRLDAIALFLQCLINSLRENHEIGELISNITGGNVRDALDLVKGFIGSPNVDSEKIVNFIREGKSYQIPLHEFSKQALLGEYSHYDPKSSLAYNLFDISQLDKKEHFLSSIILGFLKNENSPRDREGFVKTSDVIYEMQGFGFLANQTESSLRRLTNKKLIETTERVTFDEGLEGLIGDMPVAFRITTVGAYHLERWLSNFAYIDAMVFDTPILDGDVQSAVLELARSFDINDRLARSRRFLEYLNHCWGEMETKPDYFDWLLVYEQGKPSFESVERAVKRKGGAIHGRTGRR